MTARKPPPPKEFAVLDVHHVVDGDTVDLLVLDEDAGEIDGWKLQATKVIRCRLVHLDTPEDDEPGYDEAADELGDWLMGFDRSVDGGLRVWTQGKDSFGRYLSDIYHAYNRDDTASLYMVTNANEGKGWPVWIKGQ